MFECSPHVYIFCVFFACTFLPLVPFLSLYFLHVFPMVPFGNGLPVALQASGYASSVEMKKNKLSNGDFRNKMPNEKSLPY